MSTGHHPILKFFLIFNLITSASINPKPFEIPSSYKTLEKIATGNKNYGTRNELFMTFGKGNNGSTRLIDIQGPIGINANELLALLNK